MNSMKKIDIKKGIPPAIHILFCIVILTIPLLVMLRNGLTGYGHHIGYLVRTSMLIVLFYVNYLFLIDRFLFGKQFLLYVVINIILIGGSILLQNLLFELFAGPLIASRGPRPGPPPEMRVLSDYVITIFVVGMSVALKATQRWYRDSINLETIKASQLEADLKNLRSQLNPHFLFNTLNNIYSLIAIDTAKAQDSIHRLSGLLRYILYENEQNFVSIEKELEFTQNYIDLMRLRLGANVKVNVVIKNNNRDKQIASLLFMTLIENAFKHGISNGANSFIDIKILVDNDRGVLCTVENSVEETKDKIESRNQGIGLANLRKRLELLYPGRYELQVEQKEGRFSVLLRISFDDKIEKE